MVLKDVVFIQQGFLWLRYGRLLSKPSSAVVGAIPKFKDVFGRGTLQETI